jgi:hypothetical protein
MVSKFVSITIQSLHVINEMFSYTKTFGENWNEEAHRELESGGKPHLHIFAPIHSLEIILELAFRGEVNVQQWNEYYDSNGDDLLDALRFRCIKAKSELLSSK